MPDTRALPHRFAVSGAVAFLGYLAAALVMLWSLAGAGWSAERLIAARPRLADFLSCAWPPSADNLGRLAWKMVEALQIAVAGAAIGILLSPLVALLATRELVAGRAVNKAVRVVLGVIRAAPDLVWALLFVVAVSLGPFAGVMAMAIDTLGVCGRFFADDMESTDPGPAEALTTTGARRLYVAAASVVPAAMPAFASTALSALEKAVRSSTILGLAGAGGIGIGLKVAFDLFHTPTALTVIPMIAVVVEQLGAILRQRIMGTAR